MNDTPQGPIEPITFTPVTEPVNRKKQRLTVAAAVIGVVLVFCLLILWFLLTSRALVISTNPVDAVVELDGGIAFPLSDSYLVRPGSYQVTATAPGYFPETIAVSIAEEQSQQVSIVLKIKPGNLEISGVPADTTLLLDGNTLGSAPGTFTGIEAGEHQLVLTHPRFRPHQQALSIRGKDLTDTLEISLQPAWGEITLDSRPSGAAIRIGERDGGTTPSTIQVHEEGESVSLHLAGYKTWTQILQGIVDQPRTLEPITLEPADAQLHLSTTPTGARVLVDNQYRGVTPLTVDLSPGESHKLAVFQAGYQDHVANISLASGESRDLSIKLIPRLGTLKVQISPPQARLYVDNQLQNLASNNLLELPARPHSLEARLDGYAPQKKTVTPKPGVQQQVTFNLLTEKEAQRRQLPAQITLDNGLALKLFSPDGSLFTLGSSRREQGRRANEVQRDVILQRPFYLATTPVTNSAFKNFRVTHSSSHAKGQTLDLPDQGVVNITWQDAALYCNWLSEKENLPTFYQAKNGRITGFNPQSTGYRLPTEAEWAWAARNHNGTMKKFLWGESFPPPANAANFADQGAAAVVGRFLPGYRDDYVVSAPVTRYPPNPKGLYSLGHNISEWVHDFYGIEPSLGTRADTDPLGPEKGEYHVIRGASWRHGTITELRLSFRDYGNDKRDDVGFRLARYAQ